MALAATDSTIEARIARLESDLSHVRSDVAEVKQDVRDLRARVDNMWERFEDRFNEQRDRSDAVERSLASAKVWALMLFIAQAAAVYGTLARTMGWI